MAMACYPDIQKKARQELDRVIGPNHLPTFEDRQSLPYVTAIAKESMRWRSVAPLGIPHRSLADDDYNGYFIPAGSTVIANIWQVVQLKQHVICTHDYLRAFARDTRVYADPEAFNPDRFLKDGLINPEVLDPSEFVFGYGRRYEGPVHGPCDEYPLSEFIVAPLWTGSARVVTSQKLLYSS